MKKKLIRKNLIKKRLALDPLNVSNLSKAICCKIKKHPAFKEAKIVAAYCAFNNEVLLNALFKPNQTVLPVITDKTTMTFNKFLSTENLKVNKFSILEPENSNTVISNSIDLCLVPLVGFNRNGDRLGMGGGFYDRYFMQNKTSKKPTILAGIAYDFQEDGTIKSEAWDIPLDIIFTNKEVIEL